jgi:signal transduction histidine kinase
LTETHSLRLAEQLITAEQDERRRIALFLHDGPVQTLAGIALMLDAVRHAIEDERLDDARRVLDRALTQQRDAIRSLRDLSFNLEPVVLRDQGIGPAVQALADDLGPANDVEIDVDVEAAEALAEKVQAAVYQIIRETLETAIRRGPPTRIDVRALTGENGGIEICISDDGPSEQRRRYFEMLNERARALNATLSAGPGDDGSGTQVRVALPPYASR